MMSPTFYRHCDNNVTSRWGGSDTIPSTWRQWCHPPSTAMVTTMLLPEKVAVTLHHLHGDNDVINLLQTWWQQCYLLMGWQWHYTIYMVTMMSPTFYRHGDNNVTSWWGGSDTTPSTWRQWCHPPSTDMVTTMLPPDNVAVTLHIFFKHTDSSVTHLFRYGNRSITQLLSTQWQRNCLSS